MVNKRCWSVMLGLIFDTTGIDNWMTCSLVLMEINNSPLITVELLIRHHLEQSNNSRCYCSISFPTQWERPSIPSFPPTLTTNVPYQFIKLHLIIVALTSFFMLNFIKGFYRIWLRLFLENIVTEAIHLSLNFFHHWAVSRSLLKLKAAM